MSWFSISVQITNATGTKNLSFNFMSIDLLFSSSEDPSLDFAPLSLNYSPDWSTPTACWISLVCVLSSVSVPTAGPPKAGNPRFERFNLSALDDERNELFPLRLGTNDSRSSASSSGCSWTAPNYIPFVLNCEGFDTPEFVLNP
jgi:hypothetical protein